MHKIYEKYFANPQNIFKHNFELGSVSKKEATRCEILVLYIWFG